MSRIPVDGQSVCAVQDHDVAVAAIQVGDRLAPLDPSRIPRHGDHVLEDHVFGEELEECSPSTRPASPSSMIRKNGSSAAKSVDVVHGDGHPAAGESQAWALRRAKSPKVVGGRPVTLSMSSWGVEPLPEMMAPVSHRSITA